MIEDEIPGRSRKEYKRISQDAADWRRLIFSFIRDGDIKAAKHFARHREVNGHELGSFGYMGLGELVVTLHPEINRLRNFEKSDPTLLKIKERFGAIRYMYFKEKLARMVQTLKDEQIIASDFDFEAWWESIPEAEV